MPFPYPSPRIHEIIQAAKVAREGETFTVSSKGQRGASFDVNLDLLDGAFTDLRYLGGANDVAMPESYKG